MTEVHKRTTSSVETQNITSKRYKPDLSMSGKERKEKFGERIQALQQLICPYGKTDTASVLLEATEYIGFLHEQVKVLSAPYICSTPVAKMEGTGQYSLRSKGLCLVPISSTSALPDSNGADIWAPIKSSPGLPLNST